MSDLSPPSFNSVEAYTFYERIRHRLPTAQFPQHSESVPDIMSLCDSVDLFVFDAYGVLNVGENPVPGAAEQIKILRSRGKQVVVLTNGASFTQSASVEKFRKLGYDFSADEVFSSRMASEQAVLQGPPESGAGESGTDLLWGVVARDDFQAADLPFRSVVLEDNIDEYNRCDAILFLSSSLWNLERQKLLTSSLSNSPRRIIIANPDVVAPHGSEFSTEPGFYGHSLADETGINVEFHGKPFPSVFEMIAARFPSIKPERLCMVGDTLHTDVLGGCSRGWQTLLVSDHGLFSGMNIEDFIAGSGIVPDWIVPTI